MGEKRKTYEFSFKNEIMHKLEKSEMTQSSIAKQYNIPRPTISRWWKEFCQNGEFTDPGNRNDAIPSWSGFNYQGKVMILCVLQKINDNLSKGYNNFKQYCVELEKLQDFIFKESEIPISLWQVKATLSKKTLNSYNDALQKIIEDKQKCGNNSVKCFLISAVEIKDWNINNIYSSQVSLYKYNDIEDGISKCIKVCEVDVFIKKELKITLKHLLIDNKYIQQIYLILCQFIDMKVAQFHDIGQTSTYEIYFSEFIQHIKEYNKYLTEMQALIEKENCFKRIANLIKDSINSFCEEECNMELGDCFNECGVLRIYQYLQSIDLIEYMKIILPDKHGNDIHEFGIADSCLYSENICEIFKDSEYKATFQDGGKIFIKVNKGKVEVIPTLMEFRRNKRNQEKRISQKLKDIETNEFITNKIKNGILSAYTDQAIFQTEGDKFTTINLSEVFDVDGDIVNKKVDYPKSIMSEKSGFRKFTNTNNNIIVVDCEKVKEYLKEINRNE